jgi:hypothetical protein
MIPATQTQTFLVPRYRGRGGDGAPRSGPATVYPFAVARYSVFVESMAALASQCRHPENSIAATCLNRTRELRRLGVAEPFISDDVELLRAALRAEVGPLRRRIFR